MTVLVTAAGKHGATLEIAEAIALELRVLGVAAEFVPPADVIELESYEAVVLGSAVYTGHWLPAATAFVDAHADVLRTRPVWLFSSGPIGDPPKPLEVTADAEKAVAATQARDHQIFAGRLDRHELGFAEKAIMRLVRASEGDFRDWDAVKAWAASIASVCQAGSHVG